jgi:hypothetical protein
MVQTEVDKVKHGVTEAMLHMKQAGLGLFDVCY